MSRAARQHVRGSFEPVIHDNNAGMRVDESAQMFKNSATDMRSYCEVKGEGSIQASNPEDRNARNLEEYIA